jgi:hypothetical protein
MIRVLPGQGSFTLAGQVWSLDFAGNVTRDGFDVPGGTQTSALELYNGQIYVQDAVYGRWWYWDTLRACFMGPVAAPP